MNRDSKVETDDHVLRFFVSCIDIEKVNRQLNENVMQDAWRIFCFVIGTLVNVIIHAE